MYPPSLESSLIDNLLSSIDPDNVPDTFESYQAWLNVVTPHWTWDWPHQLYLYPYLEKYLAGEIPRLMINLPPRHGKTELVTVRLPAYVLEQDQSQRIITGSYNQSLANKFSRKTRRVMESRIELSKERNAANEWETLQEGGLRAVGVGTGVTGTGANHIMLDDPTKSREEANSKVYQQKVYDWYTDDIMTRLEPGGQVILTQTRWGDGDLSGKIMASEDADQWVVVNLPSLAEVNDPLGRKEGEALCPERYDEEALLKIKKTMGQNFYSLYQGTPVSHEGAIFKNSYWQYYTELPPREEWKRTIMSLDTAFKTGESNDYSACGVAVETNTGLYMVDVLREKLEFPDLKRRVIMMADTYKTDAVLIEDKASGQSLIQDLKRDTFLPVIPVKVDRDKETRAWAAVGMAESGNVYLPSNAVWLTDFVNELSRFPTGSSDDQVDMVTQLINYVKEPEPMGMW